jgi:endo-1,4-beta-D-glucanase Y
VTRVHTQPAHGASVPHTVGDTAAGQGAPGSAPPGRPPSAMGPRPHTRAAIRRGRQRGHGATRRMIIAVLAPLVVAAAVAALALQGGRQTGLPVVQGRAPRDPAGHAAYDARAFLTRYEDADGRVVRRDQGGDTVSEGQAYAMLLAVAVGDERRFVLAWDWAQANLQLPDKLLSYHWAGGQVVGADPASDADLDTAWALVLAANRFHDPAYRTAGVSIASAVLANETVSAAGGPVLVAGPWARTAPYALNPSYLAPEAMTALHAATGDARWTTLRSASVQVVARLTRSGGTNGPPRLPPDWVKVDAGGGLTPSGEPNGSAPPNFGLDAQRVPVWLASSCTAGARPLSAAWWPVLARAGSGGADLSYTLTGASRTTVANPLGLVAAAASAAAGGHGQASARLLGRADAQANKYHTYYGDAWVALGRVLLDTRWLSPCAPTGH